MKIVGGKVLIGKEFQEVDIEFDEKIREIGGGACGGASSLGGEAGAGEAGGEAGDEATCDAEVFDASGLIITPGFVDIHTHGGVGVDFSDGDYEGLKRVAAYYGEHGVTSFLGTTMTISKDKIIKAVTEIGRFIEDQKADPDFASGKCAGIHLEGPFISEGKKGAQNACDIIAPSISAFNEFNQASGGNIRIITMAPETEGALEFIREVTGGAQDDSASEVTGGAQDDSAAEVAGGAQGCVVSIGHTVANFAQADAGFKAGATHATHLYNGMTGFAHRDPAVIGAAYDNGASVELICDGNHVAPTVIRMTFEAFGERVNLISDSLRCAYMPDGDYELGGQAITLKNGLATLKDSTTIAGSVISLHDAVKFVAGCGIPLEMALYCASTAPAKAARLDDIGSIAIGKSADFVALNKNLDIVAIWVNGRRIR